jgi:hypothetical protein
VSIKEEVGTGRFLVWVDDTPPGECELQISHQMLHFSYQRQKNNTLLDLFEHVKWSIMIVDLPTRFKKHQKLASNSTLREGISMVWVCGSRDLEGYSRHRGRAR